MQVVPVINGRIYINGLDFDIADPQFELQLKKVYAKASNPGVDQAHEPELPNTVVMFQFQLQAQEV
jgi:hypothetical protein